MFFRPLIPKLLPFISEHNFVSPVNNSNRISWQCVSECVCAQDHSAFFTNFLQAYNQIKAAGHPFEVLFASSDIDQNEFNSNSRSMPWMKLPYADPKDLNSTAQLLFSKFALKGIPSLVVLDPSGKLCLSIDISHMTFIRSSHFR